MALRLTYPVSLGRQCDGTVLVSFPDIPEALTEGTTEEEALAEAADCLIAVLGGYIQARCHTPRRLQARGRPLAAAKAALCGAMRAQGVGDTALAE